MSRSTDRLLILSIALLAIATPLAAQNGDILWAQRGTGPHHANNSVYRLEYSSDGRTLLESVSDGFRRWDPASGELLGVIPATRGVKPALGESYSPDGRHILGRNGAGWFVLLSSTLGIPLDSVYVYGPYRASFTDDGTRVLLGTGGTGALRRFPSLEVERNIQTTGFVAGEFTQDRRYLLRPVEGLLVLTDVATGEEARRFAGASGIGDFGFIDGDERIVGYNGRDLALWNTTTAERIDLFRDRELQTHAFLVMRNGGRLAITLSTQTVTGDSTLRVWDMIDRRRTHDYAMRDLSYPLKAAAMSPDETELAVLEASGTIAFIDVESGAILRRTGYGHPLAVLDVAGSADGRFVATAGADHSLRLFDASNGTPLFNLGVEGGHYVSGLDLSDDGRYVAYATQGSGTANYVNVINTESLARVKTFFAGPAGVDIAPDNSRYAVACSDGSVRIVDIDSDDELMKLEGHGGAVYGVAYSADGSLVASYGSDMAIVIWDAQTGELRRTLTGVHTNIISDVVFAPDGLGLVSVGYDARVVRWWLDGTRKLLFKATETLWSVGVTPDGMTAIATGTTIYGVDMNRGGIRTRLYDPLSLGNGVHLVESMPREGRFVTGSGDGDVVMWRMSAALDVPQEPAITRGALDVRPVPATSALTLRYELERATRVDIAIDDASGRRVLATSSEGERGEQVRTLDIGELSPGVYMISLRAGGDVSTSRFVVVE